MTSFVILVKLLSFDVIVAWIKMRKELKFYQPPEPLHQGPGTKVLYQFSAGSEDAVCR